MLIRRKVDTLLQRGMGSYTPVPRNSDLQVCNFVSGPTLTRTSKVSLSRTERPNSNPFSTCSGLKA